MAAQASIEALTAKTPKWDDSKHTFAKYQTDLEAALVTTRCASSVAALNVFNLPEPAADDKPYYKARAWGIILKSVSDKITVKQLQDIWEDKYPGGEAWQKGNPNQLWETILERSNGPVADIAGDALMEDIENINWPTTAGLTIEKQVTTLLDELDAAVLAADRLDDAEFPFTQGLACRKFRKLIPKSFLKHPKVSYHAYETIKSTAAMRTLSVKDAKMIDKDRGAETTDEHEMLSALLARIGANEESSTEATNGPQTITALLTAALSKAGGNPKRSTRQKFTKERLMNRSEGPPWPSSVYCDTHGWCAHKSDTCRSTNDNSTEKDSKLHVRNEDGTFTQVSRAQLGLCTVADIRVAAMAAQIDPDQHIFVDTGAEMGIETQLNRMQNVVVLDPTQAPLVDGTVEGPPGRATHRGTRTNDCGDITFTEPVYYVPQSKYRISAVKCISKCGIATLVTATDHDSTGQPTMYLVQDDNIVQCNNVGDIWSLPIQGAALKSTILAAAIHIDNDGEDDDANYNDMPALINSDDDDEDADYNDMPELNRQ